MSVMRFPGGGAAVDAAVLDRLGNVETPPGSARTGTFTLALADAGKVLEANSSGLIRVVIPTHTALAFPTGFECEVAAFGAGAVTIAPAAENLFANDPSFGSGITGWGIRNSTLSHLPSGGVDTTGAMRATASSSATYGAFGPLVSFGELGLTAGDTVSARMWLSPSAGQARFSVRFQLGSATVSDSYAAFRTTAGVAQVDGIVVPVAADSLRFVLDATGGTTGTTLDVDQALLTTAPTAPSVYTDGASPGGFWLGTANASASMGPLLRGQRMRIPRYGRLRLRHTGSGVWLMSLAGVPSDVLLDSDTLTVDRDNGQTGIVAPLGGLASPAATALTANTLHLARFVPSRPMAITMIGYRVTTAAATNAPVEVALFNSSLQRITTSGAVTSQLNSTGTKAVSIGATALLPGVVYYAGVAPSAAVSLACASFPGNAFGSSAPQAEMMTAATSYPTPTTVTGAVAADAVPQLYVREA